MLPRVKLIKFPFQDIFLACFSVMSPESFDNVDAKWLKEVSIESEEFWYFCNFQVKHHSQAPLMLVGTKVR